MLFRRLLAIIVITAFVAASNIAQALNPENPERDLVPTAWLAQLPFVPTAAMVTGNRIDIGRINGATLQLASANLTPRGVDHPPSEDGETRPSGWTAQELAMADFAPQADALFAAAGSWFLVDQGNNRVTAVSALDASDGTADDPVSAALPLADIESLIVDNNKIFLFVHDGVESWVASHRFDTLADAQNPEDWFASLPSPDRRSGAALFSSHARIHLVGGEVAVNETQVSPEYILYAEYDSDGKMTSWGQALLDLPRQVGQARAVEMNESIALMGERPFASGDVTLTSQTMLVTHDRPGTVLAAWREVVVNVPVLDDPLVLGYENAHQLLLLGGKSAAKGDENHRLYAYQLVRRPTTLEIQAGIKERMKSHPGAHKLVPFEEGLAEAAENGRHHLVLVLDDSEPSEELRGSVNLDRNIHVMLEGMVLSETSAESKTLQTQVTAPGLVLMDSKGNILGQHQGPVSAAELHQLMKPVWEPNVQHGPRN